MEVHHHPDLHHKKKNFREYFLEFLMIFLAVTMGFFAESLREHIGDRSREKEYMQSLFSDLKNDSAQMKDDSLGTVHQSKGLDTIILSLRQPLTVKKNLCYAYIMYLKWGQVYTPAIFSNGTITELKNAGALRVIQNRKIVDLINRYEGIKELVMKTSDEQFKLTSDIEHNHAGAVLDLSANAKIIDLIESDIKLPCTDSLMNIAQKDTLLLLDNSPIVVASFRNNIKSLKALKLLYSSLINYSAVINQMLRDEIRNEYHID